LPSGIATDAETSCPARGPVMPRPLIATFRRTAARGITRDRRPALHSPANRARLADRSGRAPLLGLEGPFSVFQRRCAIRSLPVSELCRFDVFGRPGRIGVSPTPRVPPAGRPCGFSPDATDRTIALVSSPKRSSRCSVRRPPPTTFANTFLRKVWRTSRRGRDCTAWPAWIAIHWPATPMGFLPFAALCRMRQFRVRRPHRRPTCRSSVTSTSESLCRGTGRDHCQIRSQASTQTHGRSGCGGLDFWALTRPSSSSAAVALGGELMLPWALPLSGLGHEVCNVTGASRRVHRPSPFRFRRLSALELRRRLPASRKPRWLPDQSRPGAPALQRFSRPMPCSSDPALPGAGRTSRMRFFTC
jgi:hypothetical protein